MKTISCWLVGVTLGVACLSALAQTSQYAPRMPYQEYANRIKSAQQVEPLKSDLFGESISLYNGSTEFSYTDVAVPGNSALPVSVGRRLKVQSLPEDAQPLGGFGTWDIDVPHISGTFVEQWMTAQNNGLRCSNFSYPGHYDPFEPTDFYSGVQLAIPGRGEQEVLRTGNIAKMPLPTDGQVHPLGTRSFDRIRCKSQTANGFPGEGFVVRTADGLTYTLDVGFMRNAGVISKPTHSWEHPSDLDYAHRFKVYLAASRVEDRFGNWVAYQWSGDKLTGITANDGRAISIGWAGDKIQTVTTNNRTWTYSYGPDGMRVTLPDTSYWLINVSGSMTPIYMFGNDDSRCAEKPPAVNDPATLPKVTMRHPSGATGTFEFALIRHRRNGIPASACQPVYTRNGESIFELVLPNYFDVYSVTSKTIEGSGLGTQRWQYEYEIASGEFNQYATAYCESCERSKSVWVKAPDNTVTEHRFGVVWQLNDGRSLATYIRDAQGKVVKANVTEYVTDTQAKDALFPDIYGAPTSGDDGTTYQIRPVATSSTYQDGAIAGPDGVTPSGAPADRYTRTTTAFDEFARPTAVVESNSLGYSRSVGTTYYDERSLWVLSQVKSESVDGIETSRTDFDTRALPWRTYSFGNPQPQLELGYHALGMLAAVKDGRGNTTLLNDWMRGVPRQIQHPATPEAPTGALQKAEVDGNGWIRSVTDENGFLTGYAYDAMGRISAVTYPTGDTVAWAGLSSNFRALTTADQLPPGIAAGQWRHEVVHGSYRKGTYYDALWRPVLVHEYDAARPDTLRATSTTYDVDGRVTFQSYPSNALTPPAKGIWSRYDALGRVIEVKTDSELGALSTTTVYEAGLKVTVTNPRQKATTTSFMAYGAPSLDWPVTISHPEGAYTDITRDVLGKPRALKRRNADHTVAVTRHFVYDAFQRLCKTVEPETGATVMDYDAAGNLQWSAAGLPLTSLTGCDTTAARDSDRKVTRYYDARNRVQHLRFLDGFGDQDWTYTPDSLPERIVTSNGGTGAHITNEYTYNKRRLLTSERLVQIGAPTLSIGYAYSPLGGLLSHTYPSGRTVDYAPNALGQPTQAGAYATGVSYFANGAMSGFTYGNGIVHSLIQNDRGLPDRSADVYGTVKVMDDGYDYDQNGNVVAISDGARNGRGNRDMTYDGLDRLRTTTSPMFAPATYTYDVLDNLRTVRIGSRDQIYDYDASWRLTNIRNAVGGASVAGLGYDRQGNLENKNGQLYSFSHGNRLRAAAGKETYRYDGHGRRAEAMRSSDGAPIMSFYGQDGVLRYQRDHRQAKSIEYAYLNGSQVARISDVIAPWKTSTSSPAYNTEGAYAVQWPAVTGATVYEMQESANGGAWATLSSGSGLSTTVSGRSSGQYQYRVRACNTAGCSEWGSTATTTVELPPVGVAVLAAPSTAANGDYTVSWNAVSGATSYVLEESANGGAWTVVSSTGSTSKVYTGRAAGTYAYRVKACNGAGCAAYSTTATVQVVYQPGGATLTAPASNYTGSYTVSWTVVSNATSYQLEESANSGVWTLIHNAAATSFYVTGRGNGGYAYRVTACNAAGCGAVSASKTVQVTLPPGGTPTVSAPSSASFGNYTVSWTAVSTASSYALEESVNGGTWASSYSGTATSKAYANRPAGSYAYRVRGCNVAGCGPYSATVTVQSAHPPSTPTVSAPATSYTGSYTVSSSTVANATSYRLDESYNGGAWTQVHNASTSSLAVSGRTNGSYAYRATACNAVGCSAASGTVTVQVTLPPGSTAVSAPAGSATGNYTVAWNAVANATSYQLEESQSGGAWTLLYNGAALSVGLGGRPHGTHHYRARACNVAGCSPYSAVAATAVTLPPAAPAWVSSTMHVVYHGDVVTSGSCAVAWPATERATSYNLRVTGGGVTYSGSSTTVSSGLGTNYCASSHEVQACNAGACSGWSPASQQSITEERYPGGEVVQ